MHLRQIISNLTSYTRKKFILYLHLTLKYPILHLHRTSKMLHWKFYISHLHCKILHLISSSHIKNLHHNYIIYQIGKYYISHIHENITSYIGKKLLLISYSLKNKLHGKNITSYVGKILHIASTSKILHLVSLLHKHVHLTL